jgi:hypothetical protein
LRVGVALVTSAIAALAGPALSQSPATAGAPAASSLVHRLYGGSWPTTAAVEDLEQQRLDMRGVQAYLATLPALNMIGLRDGSQSQFGAGYEVLPIWKGRMNAKTLVPTPNCDVVYSMSYLDLKKSGPLVVYAPTGVIGLFSDFLQRTITDVGALGPDKGQGGMYLLLPPDHPGSPSSRAARRAASFPTRCSVCSRRRRRSSALRTIRTRRTAPSRSI